MVHLPLVSAFFGRFISSAGVLALNITLTRKLDLIETGEFFGAFAVLMGVSILLQFGMPTVILRTTSKNNQSSEELEALLSRSLSTITLFSLLISAVWIITFGMRGSLHSPMALVFLAIIPVACMGAISSFLKAQKHPGWGGFWEAGILSLIGTGAVFLFSPNSAISAWFVFTASCWIGMFASFFQVGLKFIRDIIRPRLDLSLIIEGRYLCASTSVAYLSVWGGVIISTIILSHESTAALNAILRTLAPLQFLIMTIDFYVAPKFSSCTKDSTIGIFQRARFACVVLSAPYLAIVLLFPSQFLSFVYGDDYAIYATHLQIIMLGIFIQLLLGPTGILLNMMRKDRTMLALMILKASIYLIGCVVLASRFGLIGIPISLSASIMIQSIAKYIIARSHYLQR